MTRTEWLPALLEQSARARGSAVAVGEPGGPSLTYAQLDALSDRVRDRLHAWGVKPGDRVGLRLHKSVDAVAALFGVMKTGAAYVPVDAESPAARGAYILNDCQVAAVITERALEAALVQELAALRAAPPVLSIGDGAGALERALTELHASTSAPVSASITGQPGDIAYILYTSGSTGRPKGVVLTHENAASFIDWCSATFEPSENDVFSSHAPFHFDLSILDIYVPIKHGARLVLIGEALGKDPLALAAAIASEQITSWYSTPSILSLLAHRGKLERHDLSKLRFVFFAGEVFPIPQFRALHALLPQPRYFNLYGPTETNVCTYYEVPVDGSWESMSTFPIGWICPPNRGLVVDADDKPVKDGESGELLVSGPNVMRGYWNLPEQNASAFLIDADGLSWYRTGDIVSEDASGQYRYLSRRDRMVKRRGYRVELGEIEAGLARHPSVREAAVVAVPDDAAGLRIVAFIGYHEETKLSIIELKGFSARNLPPYMVPDVFKLVTALPRTSTDKIDLQALKRDA